MVKLLMRIAICLLLVLGAVALWLGLKLYNDRVVIKGRNLKLQAFVKSVAAYQEAGDETTAKVVVNEEQVKDLVGMDGALRLVEAAASNQYARLETKRREYAETCINLTNTILTLNSTSNQLDGARAAIKEKEGDIVALKKKVDDKDEVIVQKEKEAKELEVKAVQLAKEAEELNTKKVELVDKVAQQETEIGDLKEKVRRLTPSKGPIAGGQLGAVGYVNADWNFVVLLLEDQFKDSVNRDTELLVQRADKLVGRVRVAELSEDRRIVLAEFLSDWQQMPASNGDFVIGLSESEKAVDPTAGAADGVPAKM